MKKPMFIISLFLAIVALILFIRLFVANNGISSLNFFSRSSDNEEKKLLDNGQSVTYGVDKYVSDITKYSLTNFKGSVANINNDSSGNVILTLKLIDDNNKEVKVIFDLGTKDSKIFVTYPQENELSKPQKSLLTSVEEITNELKIGMWVNIHAITYFNTNFDCATELVGENVCNDWRKIYLSHKTDNDIFEQKPDMGTLLDKRLNLGPVKGIVIAK